MGLPKDLWSMVQVNCRPLQESYAVVSKAEVHPKATRI